MHNHCTPHPSCCRSRPLQIPSSPPLPAGPQAQAPADFHAGRPLEIKTHADLRSLDLRGATLSPEGLPHLLKLSALTTLALHYIEAVAAQDIARVADAARDGARATADPGVGSGGGHAREEAAAGEGAAGPAPGPRQEADVAPAGAGTSASPGTPGHAGGAPAAGSGSSSCFTDAGTGRDTRSLGPVARALRERRQRLPAPALRSLTLGSAATWGLDCLDAAALPLHTLTEPFEVNALCFSWLAPRTPFLSLEVAVEALEEAALNLGSACPGLALPRGKLALHFPYGITYPRAFDCAQLLSVLGPLAPHLRALELLRWVLLGFFFMPGAALVMMVRASRMLPCGTAGAALYKAHAAKAGKYMSMLPPLLRMLSQLHMPHAAVLQLLQAPPAVPGLCRGAWQSAGCAAAAAGADGDPA